MTKKNIKTEATGRRVSIYWTKEEYRQLVKLKPHPMVKMGTYLKSIIKEALKIQ